MASAGAGAGSKACDRRPKPAVCRARATRSGRRGGGRRPRARVLGGAPCTSGPCWSCAGARATPAGRDPRPACSLGPRWSAQRAASPAPRRASPEGLASPRSEPRRSACATASAGRHPRRPGPWSDRSPTCRRTRPTSSVGPSRRVGSADARERLASSALKDPDRWLRGRRRTIAAAHRSSWSWYQARSEVPLHRQPLHRRLTAGRQRLPRAVRMIPSLGHAARAVRRRATWTGVPGMRLGWSDHSVLGENYLKHGGLHAPSQALGAPRALRVIRGFTGNEHQRRRAQCTVYILVY